jgi:LruC domain-containing protein
VIKKNIKKTILMSFIIIVVVNMNLKCATNIDNLRIYDSNINYYNGSINLGNLATGYASINTDIAVSNVGNLRIGNIADAIGTLEVGNSGSSLSGSYMYVGEYGVGTVLQSDGLLDYDSEGNIIYIGNKAGSSGDYAISGGVLNAAKIYVGEYGTGSVTQTGGSVICNGGTSSIIIGNQSGSIGTYTLNGGLLDVTSIELGSGNGTLVLETGELRPVSISGSVINQGVTFNPCEFQGTATIDGDYTHQEAATYMVEIRGTDLGEFDKLDVNGALNIQGGKLKVVFFLHLYTMTQGDVFDILDWDTISGTFTEFEFPEGCDIDTSELYTHGRIRLAAVGEGLKTDTDGDTVADDTDDFDTDADLVSIDYIPDGIEMGTLTFEDKYPVKGDYDFNDLVIGYKYRHIIDAANKIKAINYLYTIRAMGAHNPLGFAIQFPTVNVGAGYTATLSKNGGPADPRTAETGKAGLTFEIFNNAKVELGSGRSFVNTVAEGEEDEGNIVVTDLPRYELVVTFDTAKDSADIAHPNNPYIFYTATNNIEVHLPGTTHSTGVSTLGDYDYHSEGFSQDFLTVDGFPWAQDIQNMWDYPREKQSLSVAYPGVATWASSDGTSELTWYNDQTANYLSYRTQRKTEHENHVRRDMGSVVFRNKYNFLGL